MAGARCHERSTATVGPHIRARCYEFGADDLDLVAAPLRRRRAVHDRWGTPGARRDRRQSTRRPRPPRRPLCRRRRAARPASRDRYFSHRARRRRRPPRHRRLVAVTSAVTIDPTTVRRPTSTAVHDRIVAAGGDPDRVTVLAVTKGFGPEAPAAALAAGLHAARRELRPGTRDKAAALAGAEPPPEWHFIGRLQSNKVRLVADLVACWQSVDRASLVDEIATRAPGAPVLVQVNATGEAGKGRVRPADGGRSGRRGRGVRASTVEGLMTVGVAGDDARHRRGVRAGRAIADDLGLVERARWA